MASFDWSDGRQTPNVLLLSPLATCSSSLTDFFACVFVFVCVCVFVCLHGSFELVELPRPLPQPLMPPVPPLPPQLVTQQLAPVPTISEARDLLQLLRQWTANQNSRFKTKDQAQALHLVCHTQCDLLWVAATGAGKSLAFLLPPLRASKITVVIIPLHALLADMVGRAGLHHFVWKAGDLPTGDLPNLIFVTVEHAAKESTLDALSALANKGDLERIVLDEVHLYLTDTHFRPLLFDVFKIARVNVPLTLLTATLSPSMEKSLKTLLHLDNCTTLRGECVRPNLAYRTRRLANNDDIWQQAADEIQTRHHGYHDQDRVLVVVMAVDDCKKMAKRLHDRNLPGFLYHSYLTDTEKKQEMDSWTTTSKAIMISTTGFATGTDHPHVRLVLHLSGAFSLVNYAQETGRGGRDGQRAEALVIEHPYSRQLAPDWEEDKIGGNFWSLVDTTECLRQHLHHFLDGAPSLPCVARPDWEQCQNCLRRCQHCFHSLFSNLTLCHHLEGLPELAPVPQQHPNPANQQQQQRAVNNNDEVTLSRLVALKLLEFAEQEGCLAHALLGQSISDHTTPNCSLWGPGCFVCEGPHLARSCHYQTRQRSRCWCCNLPNIVDGIHLHPPFTSQTCRFRDVRRFTTRLALEGGLFAVGQNDTAYVMGKLWGHTNVCNIPQGYIDLYHFLLKVPCDLADQDQHQMT